MANIPDNADAQRTLMRARVVCAWWFTKAATAAKVAQATGCGLAAVNIWKPKDYADAATLPIIERKHRGIEAVWRILEGPTVTDVAEVCGISEATARKFLPADVTMVRRHRTLADMPREQSRTFAAVEDMRAGVVMTAAELAKKHGLPGPVIYQIRDRWAPEWTPVNSRRKPGSEDDDSPEAKAHAPVVRGRIIESTGKNALIKVEQPAKVEKRKLDVAELANQVAATQAAKADAAVATARAIAANAAARSAGPGAGAAGGQSKQGNALAMALAARYEARSQEREQEREASQREAQERKEMRGHGVRPEQRQEQRRDPWREHDDWFEQGQGHAEFEQSHSQYEHGNQQGYSDQDYLEQDYSEQDYSEQEYSEQEPQQQSTHMPQPQVPAQAPRTPDPYQYAFPQSTPWPAPMPTHARVTPPAAEPAKPSEPAPVVDAYQILHDAIAEAWNTIEYPTPYKVAQAVGCTPYIAIKWKPKSRKAKAREAVASAATDGPRPGTKTAEIVEALQGGVVATIRELAEQFGVDRSQVYQISKKWVPEWTPRERDRKAEASEAGESGGPATRDAPREGSKTAAIVAVMNSGVEISVRELAEQFGVERSQIYQIVKRWAPEWKPKERVSKSEEGGESVAPASRDAPREGSKTAAIAAAMTSGVPISVRELAEQFGVERSQIYQIAKRWAPEWTPKERVSKAAIKAAEKAAAKAQKAAKKAEKLAKKAAKKALRSAAASKPGRPMLVKTSKKAAGRVMGKVAPAGHVGGKVASAGKVGGRVTVIQSAGARAADAPRAGSVTEAIVEDWKAGRVATASEAAAKHGVSVTTATTALHRWTDYVGRSKGSKKRE